MLTPVFVTHKLHSPHFLHHHTLTSLKNSPFSNQTLTKNINTTLMAEVTKYNLITNVNNNNNSHNNNNNKNIFSDIRTHFSHFTTTKSSVFIYVLVLFFVVFTVFLALSPSSTTSSSARSISVFAVGSGSSSVESHTSSNDTVGEPLSQNSNKTQNLTKLEQNNSSLTDQSSTFVNVSENSTVIDPQKHMHNNFSEPTVNVSSELPIKQSSEPLPQVSSDSANKSSGLTALLWKNQGKLDINDTALGGTPKRKENVGEKLVGCDLYDGKWVRDESYPLYKPGSCKLIDPQFNCVGNGRLDLDYLKLKWKPNACSLPRLNAKQMLKLLKGKRLVFIGDSLNRNMWESLVCILKSSIKNKKKVFEVYGRHQFRTEASYSFVFKDYNCTVEFFVSPFLVQQWEMKDKDGTTKETLRLDVMVSYADQFKSADYIVFNTGHWWTHDKTSKGEDYYQEGSHVYKQLDVKEAFRRALTTWGHWVDNNIDPQRTHVFFRGYSASHFHGGKWNSGGQCDGETEPIMNEKYLTHYPWKMKVFESVIKEMKTPVSYMNVTRLTDYRKDGHPSVYRKHRSDDEKKSPLRYQDCSHWCLPGVPDSWNELLYAELLRKPYMDRLQKNKT